jgi:hypothetical protein
VRVPIEALPPAIALLPLQSPDAVQLAIFEPVTVQVSVGFTTFTTPIVGDAVRVTTGGGTTEVTSTVAETGTLLPPAFTHVSVYVYVFTVVSAPMDELPDDALAPLQSPEAVHDVGEFVDDQTRTGFTEFTVPLVGEAVSVTTGTETTGV